jgi:hypothetical protein
VSQGFSAKHAALLAAALSIGACHDGATQSNPPDCLGAPEAHAPGELIGGEDPAALLTAYFGNYDGTLTWADGGETPFTLSLDPGTNMSVYAPDCAKPPTFYTYIDLGLTTTDGGLDETDESILEVPLPAAHVDSSLSVLGPSVLADWQWRGNVTPHLPRNIASYTDRGLLPVIDWPLGTPRPTSLLLYFYAKPSGTTVTDQILVGSVTFP